jgi:hypothetical protein
MIMKRLSRFLVLKSNFLITIVLFTFCSPQQTKKTNDYKLILNYLKEYHNVQSLNNFKRIFVLTENGCSSCNKKFSKLMLDQVCDSSSLFLIFTSGTRVDISKFIEKKNNIYFDSNLSTFNNNLFDSTSIIYLKNNSIDTIITI